MPAAASVKSDPSAVLRELLGPSIGPSIANTSKESNSENQPAVEHVHSFTIHCPPLTIPILQPAGRCVPFVVNVAYHINPACLDPCHTHDPDAVFHVEADAWLDERKPADPQHSPLRYRKEREKAQAAGQRLSDPNRIDRWRGELMTEHVDEESAVSGYHLFGLAKTVSESSTEDESPPTKIRRTDVEGVNLEH
ncbi:hypothetical protein BV25DRAFT_1920134 [Artomyces pyxidatus]|uniref:Uncharacterized protein n=1 Tax=Artomyces pyxidatus TaxID=48021 RepID=A0ACB8SNR5_9AGAM|nr:hypothetical protein BV25DRAFT_1920134 [Artomyces pyxidatus]